MGQDLVGKTDRTSMNELALDDLRRPGKGTLVSSTIQHPCDGVQDSPACRLTTTERQDARHELVLRMANAGAAFTGACVELRVQQYLQKSEPSALMKFLLNVLTARVSTLVDGAFRSWAARAKKRVENSPVEQNDVRLYLSQLAAHGAAALQDLAHDVLAYGTDAEIVAFRDAYDASKHTLDIYRSLLLLQLEKFQDSGILEMGTHRANRVMVPGGNADGPFGAAILPVDRTTRCVWLVHPGKERELALVSTDQLLGPWDRPELPGVAGVKVIPPDLWEAAMHAHAKIHHTPPAEIPVPVPAMKLGDVP